MHAWHSASPLASAALAPPERRVRPGYETLAISTGADAAIALYARGKLAWFYSAPMAWFYATVDNPRWGSPL
jgi:hypothetical protein